jgi:hypothetical protein
MTILREQIKQAARPRIGVMPKKLHRKIRFYEVCSAISRYYSAGKKIPIEWVEEYNELVDEGIII